MAAWYVFHYHAFPRIMEKRYGTTTNWLIVLTVGLTLSSILLYSFFQRGIQFRRAGDGQIAGFQVHDSDLVNIPTSLLAALVCLLIYEAFAQFYYRTIELHEQQGLSRHRILNYLLLTLASSCLILWIFVGSIANFAMGRGGVLVGLVIVALTVGFHYLFYKKLLPFFANYLSNSRSGWYYLSGILLYDLASFVLFLLWKLVAASSLPYPYLYLYLLPSAVGLVTAYMRRYFFEKNQQLQTQVLRKSTELDTLRSQVNPHFLFNALNTLYSVALKEGSEKTADCIQKLGDMMRFMLDENNQERIPLRKEIEYLHNFLNLQRMRLDEGHEIEIRVNIQELEQDRYLAPMLLNPFVENAFKHGISLRQPSWIYITLTLDATKLYFKVHNSIHPKTGNDPEENHSGIGLENVRKRLDLLYPNRYSLDIQATERDYFVSLVLEIS
ncbi:sensor protein lytS [Cytophagaceae bacterium SJW1-29]|uniref:Sensor protein lytS n=2 Tax=Salmonirosea aquatica TaxID=2654236 RepID=A0A7C9BFQ1_9BACT|nr:sensor protein lytS [Cytophagaceae bacterium SJW1-29]